MQAIIMPQAGAPDVLQLREIETPSISNGNELLVRVRAAGVNPVDTKLRANGTYFLEQMPAVLGCDGAGIVEAVGDEVTRFEPGDEVYYCYGGLGKSRTGNYAEFTIVDEAYVAHKPESLSYSEAAAAPLVLITAWEALFDRAHAVPGSKVLIHAGAGGVGHAAIQLAKIAGAEVATTISSKEKADFVAGLGADKIINYREEDFQAVILDWADGAGVDLAFDTVGGETFTKTIPAVRCYGDLVTILQVPADTDWKTARLENLRISQELMLTPQIIGMKGGAQHHCRILSQCTEWIEEGQLKIHVSQTLPLSEAARAHELIEQGGMIGKIVLEIA